MEHKSPRCNGRLACAVLPLMVLFACGPENPLGRRAVTGRIMLDGSPLKSGHIQFVPLESGGVAAGAMIHKGEYRFEKLRGLPPGKYRVQIFSPVTASESAAQSPPSDGPPGLASDVAPNMPRAALRTGIERIPSRYNSASELTAEITAAGPTRFDFDLKSK